MANHEEKLGSYVEDFFVHEGYIESDDDIQMKVAYKDRDYNAIFNKKTKECSIHSVIPTDEKDYLVNKVKEAVKIINFQSKF